MLDYNYNMPSSIRRGKKTVRIRWHRKRVEKELPVEIQLDKLFCNSFTKEQLQRQLSKIKAKLNLYNKFLRILNDELFVEALNKYKKICKELAEIVAQRSVIVNDFCAKQDAVDLKTVIELKNRHIFLVKERLAVVNDIAVFCKKYNISLERVL